MAMFSSMPPSEDLHVWRFLGEGGDSKR